MTFSRLVDLEVDVATLRRRLDTLEARITGTVGDLPGPHPAFRIYTHLLLTGLVPSADSAALMRSCVLMMTPRTLLDLGRLTSDLFPWRPFLGALDQLQAAGHDVHEATTWLEECAHDLMRAQGLGILTVGDVVHSPVGPLHNVRKIALSEG